MSFFLSGHRVTLRRHPLLLLTMSTCITIDNTKSLGQLFDARHESLNIALTIEEE